ncbi:MAG TPA: hypothetical protein DEA08_16465, partial [Planctomycetes bacterium]|nr:hypothetical protein [Planctomycetota bacterium]
MTEEQDETGAFDPTVIEGGDPGPSELDKQLVGEAIKRGLITVVQGDMVLESLATLAPTEDALEDPVESTVGLLVKRGLISRDKADELKDSLSDDFVPGFRLGRELGRGAMGVVYEATQKSLDRKVALKVVNPNLSANADYVKRFKREALTLAKLNHPNITQVYDFGDVDGRIFLALEFVEGVDVAEMIKEDGQLTQGIALKIVRDAALGLSHAHQAGVIHRDIKPANLLLQQSATDASDRDFIAKVTDLGLAREATPGGDGELTQAGTILGTPAYMAPEQTQGHPADYRCDIYALGASLYHMVTGQVPYADSSVVNMLVKKRTEKLPNPQRFAGGLGSNVIQLLDIMLARPPEKRYQDYGALLRDLDIVIAGGLPEGGPIDPEDSSLQLEDLVITHHGQIDLSAFRAPTARYGTSSQAHVQTAALDSSDLPPEGALAGGGEAGGAPVAVAVLVVAVLALGAWFFATRKDPGQTPPTPLAAQVASNTPAEDPSALEASLAAYVGLSPAQRLREGELLASLSKEVAALPDKERVPLELRLRSAVGEALDSTGAERLVQLNELWRKGSYASLGDESAELRDLYQLAGRNVPKDLELHLARAAAANKEGAGEAERALWTEIEAAWGAADADNAELLNKLQRIRRDYAAFTPVLDEIEQRRAELIEKTPLLVVTPVPESATVSVDGKTLGKGKQKARFNRGKHQLKLSAKGHRDLELELDLVGRTVETYYLAPLPKQALAEDPNFMLQVMGRFKELRSFGALYYPFKDLTEQWDYDGEWSRAPTSFAGLDGAAKDDWRTARRRLLPRILDAANEVGAKGWSLSWRMQPWRGTRTVIEGQRKKEVPLELTPELIATCGAEARLLANPKGQEVVVGFDRGLIYAGLRNKKGILEVQRFEQVPQGQAPPLEYQVSWDGDIAEIYVGR